MTDSGTGPREPHSLRGPIDRASLLAFRDTVDDVEPLATAALDDFFNPSELRIRLEDGIGPATTGRFDVTWSTNDDYNIHYTDEDHDCRWDVHGHEYPVPDDDPHFHPPPAASTDDDDVEDSCIEVSEVELVARATMSLWRELYSSGSLSGPNDLVDPP